MATYEGYKYKDTGRSIDLGTLNVGDNSDGIRTPGCNRVGFAVDIDSIGDSVTMAIFTSENGTDWELYKRFVIDSEASRLLVLENANLVDQCRLKYESNVGGTPTVTAKARVR